MLTENDYAELRRQSAALHPDINQFAMEYQYVEKTDCLGRYPRFRLEKCRGLVTTAIEITMEEDESGQRFTSFSPEIPFAIGYVIWGDFATPDGEQIRTMIFRTMFERIPFADLKSSLISKLRETHMAAQQIRILNYFSGALERLSLASNVVQYAWIVGLIKPVNSIDQPGGGE